MNISTPFLAAALMVAASTASSAADESQAVMAARRAQNAAIVAHQLDAIAGYWTEDVTICRALGAQVAGKAGYRKLFEGDDPKSPDTVLYQREPETVAVSGAWPLAFETGTWTGRRGGMTGEVIIRGRYSAQWVKRADHWLIRSEVFVALEGAGAGLALKAVP